MKQSKTMDARRAIAVVGAVALLAPCAAAAEAISPYARADETWISLGGTVKDVRPNSFTLDYGRGMITVEIDDGDRDADAYKLIKGDKVSVTGKIDNDFYQRTTIEASSVYVEKLGTYFFSDPKDEEAAAFAMETPLVGPRTVVRGTVADVRAGEFTINTGVRQLTVDVSKMSYDPLDKDGYQRVEAGDRVRVAGHMDRDFFEGRELKADSVIELAGFGD